ncbi:hypothetical protein [Pseudomonas sp. S1(2024)]|uniref:hypothetical protein n=1 Tax=Pseudomonas sp. S1(2024) TaxID=3390191 RepID=UPI00397C34F3
MTSKVSTADCKAFVVDFQRNNPGLERGRFGMPADAPEAPYAGLDNVKNWKRVSKTRPVDGELYHRYGDTATPFRTNGEARIPVAHADIAWVRTFDFDPADGQIAYFVFELKDGTLVMGDYIGD